MKKLCIWILLVLHCGCAFNSVLAENEVNAVISEYAQEIEENPRDPQTLYRRIEALKALRTIEAIEAAIADFDEIIEITPDDVNAYNERGLAKRSLRMYDESIEDFNKAIELDPSLADAYNNIGWALLYSNRAEESLTWFGKAANLIPNHEEAYRGYGDAMRVLMRYEESVESYSKAIAIDQSNTDTHYFRGVALRYLGQYEDAIVDFSEVIQLDESFANAYNQRGLTYVNLGQIDEAIEDYDKAIKLDPNSSYLFYNRGIALSEIGRWEESVENFTIAIELNGTLNEYHQRGIALFNLGRYEEAIIDYAAAIELDNSMTGPYIDRGIALTRLGRYEKAIQDFTRVIELNPKIRDAYIELGTALEGLERYDEAIENYTKAIHLAPEYVYIYFKRGVALFNVARYEEAIEDFNQAVALEEAIASAYFYRGSSFYYLSRYEEALADFDRALALSPDSANCYYWRAYTLSKIGRHEEAMHDIDRAILLSPNEPMFKEAKKELANSSILTITISQEDLEAAILAAYKEEYETEEKSEITILHPQNGAIVVPDERGNIFLMWEGPDIENYAHELVSTDGASLSFSPVDIMENNRASIVLPATGMLISGEKYELRVGNAKELSKDGGSGIASVTFRFFDAEPENIVTIVHPQQGGTMSPNDYDAVRFLWEGPETDEYEFKLTSGEQDLFADHPLLAYISFVRTDGQYAMPLPADIFTDGNEYELSVGLNGNWGSAVFTYKDEMSDQAVVLKNCIREPKDGQTLKPDKGGYVYFSWLEDGLPTSYEMIIREENTDSHVLRMPFHNNSGGQSFMHPASKFYAGVRYIMRVGNENTYAEASFFVEGAPEKPTTQDTGMENTGIQAEDVTASSGEATNKVLTAKVIATSTINVRDRGGTEGAIVGKASPGQEFPVLGQAESGWYEIQLPDGKTGFISPKTVEVK